MTEPKQEAFTWEESQVDRTADHLTLAHDHWDDLVAVVGLPNEEGCFPVEFLVRAAPSDEQLRRVIDDVKRELDFYLLDVGRPDPWAYAHYHCGTMANVYSKVHWGPWTASR